MMLRRSVLLSATLISFACESGSSGEPAGQTSSVFDAGAGDTDAGAGDTDVTASDTDASTPAMDNVPAEPVEEASDASAPDALVDELPPEAGAPEVTSADSGLTPPFAPEPDAASPTAFDAGALSPAEADTELCPLNCPMLPTCVPCDDGSCAEQSFECLANGSCSPPIWTCPSGSPPEEIPEYVPPAEDSSQPCAGLECGEPCNACPAGEICLVGLGWCDANANCVQVDPKCDLTPVPSPALSCKGADECPVDPCVTCENGREWCPEALCESELCASSPNLCPESYAPCAGKEDGESCASCSPLDEDCDEPAGDMQCLAGTCEAP